MTSAFCLFVFETFVSRLLALFGTIITSESGNPTPPGDKWERKLLVFGIFLLVFDEWTTVKFEH